MKSELIKKSILATAKNLETLAHQPEFLDTFNRAVSMITAGYRENGALFVAGNGGSAADAQHLVAELISKLDRDRDPIRAFALTVDTSVLTAIGNDYGYEYLFERQIRGVMKKNDVFLAISTSGNSKNILSALQACREMGVRSILLTGRQGGEAVSRSLADCVLITPGESTALIQEAHIVVYHLLCQAIEQDLIEAGLCRYKN